MSRPTCWLNAQLEKHVAHARDGGHVPDARSDGEARDSFHGMDTPEGMRTTFMAEPPRECPPLREYHHYLIDRDTGNKGWRPM